MKKINSRTGICCRFLYIIFLGFSTLITTSVYADAPRGQPDGDFSAERLLLMQAGLPENANDSQIIALLDFPDKRRGAALLIRYRKIVSAGPKLLEIVKSEGIRAADKQMAAEALCDFGNKEWVPIIKAMANDSNSEVNRDISLKFNVAGLLARVGDYSQFDVIENGLADKKDFIRHNAMFELSKFAHPTDPVTDRAAELLTDIAKTEPEINYRRYAIEGLEKLAQVKPALQGKVIEALEANVNSPDKNLRTICNIKLQKIYKKPTEPNQ